MHKKRLSTKLALPAALAFCICGLSLAGCSGREAKTTQTDKIESEAVSSVVGEPIDIEVTEPGAPLEGTSASDPQSSSEEVTDSQPSSEDVADSQSKTGEALHSEAASTLTISMVGDILLHTPVEKAALQEDGSYDYAAIFANTRDLISAADLALVNQEVILGGADLGVSGYPAFNAPFEVGDDLVESGFDVVLHATNHALDKGAKGLTACLNYWETAHPEIAVLGIHDSAEDQSEIYYYEKDGITVAILNYTYGTNGIELPSDMPYGVDYLNKERVQADLAEAEANADFTIVCPHWGTEYRLTPDDSQKKWTKIFVAGGADLIIGSHPHVIEPIEWYTDEETGNTALVYYSLGNYVNWTSGTGEGVSNRMVGGMAQVTLSLDNAIISNATSSDSSKHSVLISEYKITPLVAHVTEGTNGVTVYTLSDYSEELAKENAIISQAPDFSYDYCINLCNTVWGDLF